MSAEPESADHGYSDVPHREADCGVNGCPMCMPGIAVYPIGYQSPAEGERLGHWVLRVEGGPVLMANAVTALAYAVADRKPGPTRDVFERLLAACIEASPE